MFWKSGLDSKNSIGDATDKVETFGRDAAIILKLGYWGRAGILAVRTFGWGPMKVDLKAALGCYLGREVRLLILYFG